MKFILVISAIGCLLFAGSAFSVKEERSFVKKEKLSEYSFFTGKLADLQPAEHVIPYLLNSSLFSNYAEKARFIVMPTGQSAIYNPDSSFEMPVGTVLIKNFYYPFDFRNPSKGRRIIETRLLIHEQDGWNALPYIWNDEQTEAFYDAAGDFRAVSYVDMKGKKIQTNYIIPNKNQCKGCHSSGDRLLPIGIAARHLNKAGQLEKWKAAGILSGMNEQAIPANSNWEDAQSASTDSRARSYLDINCGHCHKPSGAANTSGLFLDINSSGTALGILKTPVAAGRGSGNLSYDIVPGHPDKSILLYRMNTTDPGIAMPEIGREQIHREGLDLIREWIRDMKQ
jgi:uncharacterized repeat protein (TIGR03806 family)